MQIICFCHPALTSPYFGDSTIVLTSIWEALSHPKNCQVCSWWFSTSRSSQSYILCLWCCINVAFAAAQILWRRGSVNFVDCWFGSSAMITSRPCGFVTLQAKLATDGRESQTIYQSWCKKLPLSTKPQLTPTGWVAPAPLSPTDFHSLWQLPVAPQKCWYEKYSDASCALALKPPSSRNDGGTGRSCLGAWLSG